MPGPRFNALGKGNSTVNNYFLDPVTNIEELQQLITNNIKDGAKIYVAAERKDYYYDKATDSWLLVPGQDAPIPFNQNNKNKFVDVIEDELNSLDEAGIAAWLNAKDPAIFVAEDEILYLNTRARKGFITEWTTAAANEQIILPLNTGTVNYDTVTVDWGDGTTDTIAAGEDAKFTHTYANAGAYKVSCVGSVDYWDMELRGLASVDKLTKVVSWGDETFESLKFKGASNLASIPMNEHGPILLGTKIEEMFEGTAIAQIPANLFENVQPDIYTMRNLFKDCVNITTIPVGLFNEKFSNVRDGAHIFNGCSVEAIPTGLLDNCVSLEDFGYSFEGNNLTAIPAGLFDKTPLIDSLFSTFTANDIIALPPGLLDPLQNLTVGYYTFYQNAITAIPADFLKYNTLLTDIRGMFAQNSIPEIPAGLLNYTVNVTKMQQVFQHNAIAAIPAGLLDYMPNLTEANNAFSYNNLTAIPAGLFDKNINITSFMLTFSNNPIAEIPAGIFDLNTEVADFTGVFNTTDITTIPAALFEKNTKAAKFMQVFQNTPITAIPATLFDTVPATDFRYTFYNCSSIVGPVPDLWVQFPGIPAGNESKCFFGVNPANVTNYNDIPDAWKL